MKLIESDLFLTPEELTKKEHSNLMKFEDVGMSYYSDLDYNKRVLTHPNAEDLKERIESSTDKWKNPYKDAYIWLKGEVLDV